MSDTETTENVRVPPVPPYDDDDEPVFRPRPRKRARMLTFVLAGAMLVAAGFVGGVLLQKHDDHGSTSSSNSSLANAISRFRGGAAGTGTGGTGSAAPGAGGRGAGGGGFGGATRGTVKLVDGNNVYITDQSGNTIKVVTSDSSTITKSDPSSLKGIAPGDSVTVVGTPSADGATITATSLSDGALGGFGNFGAPAAAGG